MTPIILSWDQQIAVVKPSISLKKSVWKLERRWTCLICILGSSRHRSLTQLDNRDHSKQQHEIFVGLGLKQMGFFPKMMKSTHHLIQYLKCKGSPRWHHRCPVTQCTQTTNTHFLRTHIAQQWVQHQNTGTPGMNLVLKSCFKLCYPEQLQANAQTQ